MGYGLSTNAPKYGYQKPGGGPTASPYYKSARVLSNATPLFPSPNDQSGMMGPNPFPSLDTASAAAGSKVTAKPAFSQDQVAASLAANPHASSGGYGVNELGQAVGAPMGAAVATAPAGLYDYRTDPILQEIQAIGTQSRQDAETNTLAAKKKLAIQFGDTALAGQIGDPLTAQTAAQNPYALPTQLRQQYELGAHNADEGYNKENLFYGGTRILGQQQLADQYQSQLHDLAGQEQDLLGQLEQSRLAAILGANQNDVAGQRDAQDRALQAALAGGYSMGGFDQNGQPILTQPQAPSGGDPLAAALAPPPPDASTRVDTLTPDSLARAIGMAHYRRNPLDLLREVAG